MAFLHFPKLSQYPRRREPVSVGIPWSQGRLPDPTHLLILDGDTPLPTQVQVLGTWPDGSVRWSLVHFQPDLPGNKAKDFQLEVATAAVPVELEEQVSVTRHGTEWKVNTGPLSFGLHQGSVFALHDVSLENSEFWSGLNVGALQMRLVECPDSLEPMIERVEVEESGPLRAVISLQGPHVGPSGSSPMAYHGRVTVYAGKPYVEVEHKFVHMGEADDLHLAALSSEFRPAPAQVTGFQQVSLGEGYYRTGIETSQSAVAMTIDAETLLYQSNEHFTESFYGDFWVDWRTARGGLAISHYQAHQHYPKSLEAGPDGMAAGLYPSGAEPARILQGMGKTHRLLFHFHHSGPFSQEKHEPEIEGPDLQEIMVRSLQFQLPDVPSLPRAWYRENNPWSMDFFPVEIPKKLLTRFNEMHEARPQALGMMHFGDAPDAGYTDQGRGQGESVWVNNEYDRPHMCALYYGLTAQRRLLDSALVCARHWLDVDFCHKHADPLIEGGLKIHTAYHGTGKVVPSHEWTEGFLDYYFLTGRREGLRAARSIGRNILRHMALPNMRAPGAASVREGGWALRAMVGLYLGTLEEEWKREATRIAELFVIWQREFDALLAPYTSHSMPRVPFMASITVNSLARYLLLEDSQDVRDLIVDVVDDLLQHTLGPDGITFYKELPSLGHTAPTPHFLEALTHAYLITEDERYLQIGTRQFAALTARGLDVRPAAKFVDTGGAVISGKGGGRQFADSYSSILLFAAAAARKGLLDWYEYPFAEVEI